MSEQKYIYNLVQNSTEIAVIKLGTHVLGGSDALNFTEVLNELSKTEVKNVVIDCAAVEVMNSSGLGMLVSGMTTLKKFNIGFTLISLPKKVFELMKITRLDSIFKIYPDLDSVL